MFSGQKLSREEKKTKEDVSSRAKKKKQSIGIKSSYSIPSYGVEYKKSGYVY